MSNSYSKMIFIILFLIILSNLVSSNNIFQVEKTFTNLKFSIDGKDRVYNNSIPYKMKMTSNGTICFSFPRVYSNSNNNNYPLTFGVFHEFNGDIYFESFPNDETNLPNKKSDYKLYSVSGFEISENDTFYLLDQGEILDNNTVKMGSSKLVVLNSDRRLIKIYEFGNNTYFQYSLFTDLVIDFYKNYAYITDSGINFNTTENKPAIIILNLNNGKIYRILQNNKIFFPDEALKFINNGKIINESLYRGVGLNSLALSCDGENIIFSIMKSRMIYSISTNDILNAIKKNENDLDITYNFEIKKGYKDKIGNGFIISSKNNLYMTNLEDNNIKFSVEIDSDLMRLDFKDFSTLEAEKEILWPSAMDIHNGKIYLFDNHYNTYLEENNSIILKEDNSTNDTINYTLYSYRLGSDEYSYKRGCTNFYVKWNIITIIIWVCLGIILIIFLIFIEISLKEDKELEKEAENKEVRLSDSREVL